MHCLLPVLAGSAVLQILPQRRGDAALKTNAPRQRTDNRCTNINTKSCRCLQATTSKQRRHQGHPPNKTPEPSSLQLRISDPDYHDHKAAEQSRKATMMMYGKRDDNDDDAWSKTHHHHRQPITIGGETYSLSKRTDTEQDRRGQRLWVHEGDGHQDNMKVMTNHQ